MTTAISSSEPVAPGSQAQSGVPVDHNAFSSKQGTIPEYEIMVLLVECLKIHKANLEVKADQLKGNADLQNYWEDEIKDIHNVIPPKDATNQELEADNALNEERNSVRADDEDVIMTLSNQAHILCGESSQETNEVQQSMSVVSVVLKMFNSEADGISKMLSGN